MYAIDKSFSNSSHPSGKSSLYLNPTGAIDPYNAKYPLSWKGFIDNHKIEIIQNSSTSSFREFYDFVNFPIEFSYMESEIVKWIDDYLRIND